MALSIRNVFNTLAHNLKFAVTVVDKSKRTEYEAESRKAYFIAKKQWECFHQVHGKLMSNLLCEANFVKFMTPRYKNIKECICVARSYNNRINQSKRRIIEPRYHAGFTFTICDIMNIFANDLSYAIDSMNRDKKAAQQMYKTAKKRWQNLYQIHGEMLANTNWEVNLIAFTMPRYDHLVDFD